MRPRRRAAPAFALAPALALALAALVTALAALPVPAGRAGSTERAFAQGTTLPVTIGHRLFLIDAAEPVGAYRQPDGVAVDSTSGTVYVVDTANHRITAHGPRGEIRAVIGGRGRAPGLLLDPLGVDVAPDGSIYVADAGNFRVQRFDPNGRLLGAWGRRGDSREGGAFGGRGPVDVAVAPDGSVYVADDGREQIQKFSAEGVFERAWWLSDCNPTAGARVGPHPPAPSPRTAGRGGVTWTGGVLVEPSVLGHRFSTLAPTAPMTSVGYVDTVLAAASDGTVYAGTYYAIGRYSPDGRCLGRFGGEGIGPGRFGAPGPFGMAVGPDGDVYVSDGEWGRVQRFGPQGDFRGLWNVSGGQPRDLAFAPDGTLYLAQVDRATWGGQPGRVLRMTREGHVLEHWGRASDAPRDADTPRGIAVQPDGTVWVAAGDRLLGYTPEGAYLGALGAAGSAPGRMAGAGGLVVGATGELWLTESANHRVQAFDAAGRSEFDWGGAGAGRGQLREPTDLAILRHDWLHGWLLVAEAGNHRLTFFQRSGVWLGDLGSRGSGSGQLDTPTGIAPTTEGYWVADSGNHRLVFFDRSDNSRAVGGFGDGPGQLDHPHDVAAGAGGELFVADTGNHRVQVFDARGTPLRRWGGPGSAAGRFQAPESLAVAPGGDIFVADTGNRRVQRFRPDGTLIAHWPTLGWGRDSLRDAAGEYGPMFDLAGGPDGRIFVAHNSTGVIQRFGPDGVFETAWDIDDPAGGAARPDAIAVAVAQDGRVFALATHRVGAMAVRSVFVYRGDGTPITSWPAVGGGTEEERWPRDLAIGPSGDVYVLFGDSRNPRVWRYAADGTGLGSWRLSGGDTGNMSPRSIEVGLDGSVYTVDEYGHTVERYDATGRPLDRWSTRETRPPALAPYPLGIAVAPDGTVYVSLHEERDLRVYGPDGSPRGFLATPGGCDGAVEETESSEHSRAYYRRRLAMRPDGSLLVAWATGCVEVYATAPRSIADWRIERYANPHLAESPAVVEQAPALDHNWGGGPPDPRLPPRGFSARAEKRFTLGEPRRWEIDVASRGGLRLWVDDTLEIDAWDRAAVTLTRSIELAAGQHRILAQHRDDAGRAALKVAERFIPELATPTAAAAPSATASGTRAAPTVDAGRWPHLFLPRVWKRGLP